jgi:hypothetical protein
MLGTHFYGKKDRFVVPIGEELRQGATNIQVLLSNANKKIECLSF